jgi:hypothetical protein
MKFSKLIVWGAKLDTGHTHGFIHEACVRASKYLGIDTYWLDNRDNIDKTFFDEALVLTEQWLAFQNPISNKLPINSSATYVVHYLGNRGNVEGNPGAQMYLGKVKKLIDYRFNSKYGWGNNGVEDKNYKYSFEPEKYQKISNVSFYEVGKEYDNLYSIWATDLLPHEINFNDRFSQLEKRAFFCGTIRDDNKPLFINFAQKCKNHDVPFLYSSPWEKQLSVNQIRQMVKTSLLPLDIRPNNHLANGYIACRPIKNVSYGGLPITNSSAIRDFFNNDCAYAEDSGDLFDIAIEMQKDPRTKDLILNHMSKIQKEHTYINRIKDIIAAAEI